MPSFMEMKILLKVLKQILNATPCNPLPYLK